MKSPLVSVGVWCSVVLILLSSCRPNPTNESTMDQEMTSPPVRILFLGNSLTAGYGLEDPLLGFPSLLRQRLNQANYHVDILNAGISGETSSGGRQRLPYLLTTIPDILVLELGINDALQGYPPDSTYDELSAILKQVQSVNPQVRVLLIGFVPSDIPWEAINPAWPMVYQKLATTFNVTLVPSILQDLPAEALLPDGLHPNAEGYQAIAAQLLPFLTALLQRG